MGAFSNIPPAAITRVLSGFDRATLVGFVTVAIDLMDLADGDPDEESDPFNEGEPAFDAQSRALVDQHPATDPNGDTADGAWIESVDQSKAPPRSLTPWGLGSAEDAEEDDPQGEVTDDDPAFDRRSLFIANRSGNGPGCMICDPDYGAEELGEEEREGHTAIYGVDQTRPVSSDNPPIH